MEFLVWLVVIVIVIVIDIVIVIVIVIFIVIVIAIVIVIDRNSSKCCRACNVFHLTMQFSDQKVLRTSRVRDHCYSRSASRPFSTAAPSCQQAVQLCLSCDTSCLGSGESAIRWGTRNATQARNLVRLPTALADL